MRRPWLAPLAPLYAAGVGLRVLGLWTGLERVRRLEWPVISVGSLSAGGAGKTPLTIALVKLMAREGLGVDVLSRGYGRTGMSAERVSLQGDGASEGGREGGREGDSAGDAGRFGDEPLVIARESGAPVYVAAQRYDAGRLAEAGGIAGSGRRVHLLDDGFQHRQLARDLDIVLVSSEDLDDLLLPAGNLREGVGALKRAEVLAMEAGDEGALRRLEGMGYRTPPGQTVWRYRRQMVLPSDLAVGRSSKRVVAFCGIARPGQFFAGLEAAGLELVGRYAFRDHHRFGAADLELLRGLAAGCGAETFVTTAKDSVRLGAMKAELERVAPVLVAGLRLVFEEEADVMARLRASLGAVERPT